MNIAGVLVYARPGHGAAVRGSLARLPGVEIHGEAGADRLIVTVEDTAEAAAADTLLAIHRVDGVITAGLAYHHFEPDAAAPATDGHAAIPSRKPNGDDQESNDADQSA